MYGKRFLKLQLIVYLICLEKEKPWNVLSLKWKYKSKLVIIEKKKAFDSDGKPNFVHFSLLSNVSKGILLDDKRSPNTWSFTVFRRYDILKLSFLQTGQNYELSYTES